MDYALDGCKRYELRNVLWMEERMLIVVEEERALRDPRTMDATRRPLIRARHRYVTEPTGYSGNHG